MLSIARQTSTEAEWCISCVELEQNQPQQQQTPGKAGGMDEMQMQGAEYFNCKQAHHSVKGKWGDMENCSACATTKRGPTNL